MSVVWVILPSYNLYVAVLTPVPQNMTLFIDRVIQI